MVGCGPGSASTLGVGVTIPIPAVWVPLVGARRCQVTGKDGEFEWRRKDGTVIPTWWGDAGGRWESPDGQHYFDLESADRACDFFPTFLKHHIGEFVGQAFELRDDQAMLLTRPMFG